MMPNALAAQMGFLPIREGVVRFAVGSPSALTSNAWRIWVEKKHDIYIACRDNFRETKVSLHASGRWRMGFTTEALKRNPSLIQSGQDRAWEVWDQPPPSLPNTVTAFKLVFSTQELAVRPEQRVPSEWSKVIYIEAAPPKKLTVVTLFVTVGESTLTHESEPSFCLASLDIGGNRRAQLVAHGDPECDFPERVEKCVVEARERAISKGMQIPKEAYGYFLGHQDNGCRYLFGARIPPW
jgi:hypothetical protein